MKDALIEEGDLFAHVFGEKEPRGRVRVLGLGPTPQNVGTPGTKAKVPTKLALEMELRRQAEERVSLVLERMDQMQRQLGDLQQIVFASQRGQYAQTCSPHGSNTQPVVKCLLHFIVVLFDRMWSESIFICVLPYISKVVVQNVAEEQDNHHMTAGDHDSVHNGLDDEDMGMVVHKRVAAKTVPQSRSDACRGQEESLVSF